MYSKEEREAFLTQLRFERYFSADEIIPEQIEVFAEESGLVDGRDDNGSWIEADLRRIDYIEDGNRAKANIVISYKNRCIYIQPNIMVMETWYKLDYSSRRFNVSTDLQAMSIRVDEITLFPKLTDPIGVWQYNNILFSLKYADFLFDKGETKVTLLSSKDVAPFYIDNRIRLDYAIEVQSSYFRSLRKHESMTIDLHGVSFRKYNEYGDVESGGTGDFNCSLLTSYEFAEIMKQEASWIEGIPYELALTIGSDAYAPIIARMTSSVFIYRYRIESDEGVLPRKEIYVRGDLFECKHICGSPEERIIYLFRDDSHTAGTQFQFQDIRQYYSFGECLMLLKSNYIVAKQEILALINELNKNEQKSKKCPVCGTHNPEGVTRCRVCMFDQLTPEFINREDAKNWEENVVRNYRENHRKAH